MLRPILFALALLLAPVPASAGLCVDSPQECLVASPGVAVVGFAAKGHRVRAHSLGGTGALVTVKAATGEMITVAASIEAQMTGFITDVVARGFRGRIRCYATGGHVRRSNHYWGGACDFAQRGWGKTAPVMYRVADLAAKWGLRDGCTFRDCGHIDAPRMRLARR